MSTRVTDERGSSRYEIVVDDELAGFAACQKTRDLIVFTHNRGRAALRGAGGRRGTGPPDVDDVRTRGLAVLPICPFVQQWIVRHPEYHDLDDRRPTSRVTD